VIAKTSRRARRVVAVEQWGKENVCNTELVEVQYSSGEGITVNSDGLSKGELVDRC